MWLSGCGKSGLGREGKHLNYPLLRDDWGRRLGEIKRDEIGLSGILNAFNETLALKF